MDLAILLLLLTLDVLAAWKGVNRNVGRLEQQHVTPRRPFDD